MATDLIGVSIARSFVVFQTDSTPRYTIRRFCRYGPRRSIRKEWTRFDRLVLLSDRTMTQLREKNLSSVFIARRV